MPDLPGIRITDVAAREQTNYPLTVVAEPVAGGLSVELVYDTAVDDGPAIRRLASHLGTIVRAMAADPGMHLADLPLLDDEEAAQLVAWNATEVDFGDTRTFPEMFDDRAWNAPMWSPWSPTSTA